MKGSRKVKYNSKDKLWYVLVKIMNMNSSFQWVIESEHPTKEEAENASRKA
jgi:hypothetical protein